MLGRYIINYHEIKTSGGATTNKQLQQMRRKQKKKNTNGETTTEANEGEGITSALRVFNNVNRFHLFS